MMAGQFDWLMELPEEERNAILATLQGRAVPAMPAGQQKLTRLAAPRPGLAPGGMASAPMAQAQAMPAKPGMIDNVLARFVNYLYGQRGGGQPAAAAGQRVSPLAAQRPGAAQAQAQGPSIDQILSMGAPGASRPNDPRGPAPGPGASIDELIAYYTGQVRRR